MQTHHIRIVEEECCVELGVKPQYASYGGDKLNIIQIAAGVNIDDRKNEFVQDYFTEKSALRHL